jgi:hypothetical protein
MIVNKVSAGSDFCVETHIAELPDIVQFAEEFGDSGGYDEAATMAFYKPRFLEDVAANKFDHEKVGRDAIVPVDRLASSSLAQRLESLPEAEMDQTYNSYLRACARIAPVLVRIIMDDLSDFSINTHCDETMSEEEINAYMQQLSDTRIVLADPVTFVGLYGDFSSKETPVDIDTYDYVRRFERSKRFTAAAFFTAVGFDDKPTIVLPMKRHRDTFEFRQYMSHERNHATSPITESRVGFQTTETSGSSIVLRHTLVNEGFNERKARLDLGLHPASSHGSYPDEVSIVHCLAEFVGDEVWQDAYSPLNSTQPDRARETMGRLHRALDAAYGEGFLERLDVNTALFGIDFGFDVSVNNHLEPEIDFSAFPVEELPQRYAELDPSEYGESFMGELVATKS